LIGIGLMKKKKFFLFLLLIIIFTFTCTVNEKTGCIQIRNRTYSDLKDVKVGNTYLASYVAPGCYVNYWYYTNITGILTTNGVEVNKTVEDTEFSFKPGFWIYITAEYTSDGYETVNVSAIAHGEQNTDRTDWQD